MLDKNSILAHFFRPRFRSEIKKDRAWLGVSHTLWSLLSQPDIGLLQHITALHLVLNSPHYLLLDA